MSESNFARRARQVRAMLGLEIRKTFLRLRALPIVTVALLPVFVVAMRAFAHVISRDPSPQPLADVAQVYGTIFQLFFLRFVVFFGCFGIFTYLVRGELLERSLHFYFLAPLRRDVFLAGKYVAGVLAGSVLFGLSLLAQLAFTFLPSVTSGGARYLLAGPGLGHAGAYLAVTILAVAGYGAVFLALGLLARNPMIPAAILFGWEWINFLLPPALKNLSVVHHLQSLCPVAIPAGPFALPADPTPPWLALLLLAGLVSAILWFGSRRASRLEITYSSD
jgi:ABC-type transport system involved in multi-copper enzyme maturation permease subunit